MSKKSFIVILGLSVVATYGVAIAESILNSSANQSGFPLRFGTYALFGEASTNYQLLILDVAFWFGAIWLVWYITKKLLKR